MVCLLVRINHLIIIRRALLIHLLAGARAASVHGHVFAVLKTNSLFAIAYFDTHDLGRDAALSRDCFVKRYLSHIFGAPDSRSLPGYYLGHLKFSVVNVFLGKLHFLSHVLLELLNAHIFGHRCHVLLTGK